MQHSASNHSDPSFLPGEFGPRPVGLLVLLVFLVICLHLTYCTESAQAAENNYTPPVSRTESDFGKNSRPELQQSSSERFAELSRRYEDQKKELMELQEEYERLRVSRRIRWYLLGAAVFLVGWIIGFSARRKPKRYSLEA